MTYEQRFSKLIDRVKSLNIEHTVYIVSDVYSRFSLYILSSSKDLLTEVETKISDLHCAVYSIEPNDYIFKELNHEDLEDPKLVSGKNSNKIYFVDRHINLINWSIKGNKFDSTVPISCFYSFKGGLGRTTAMVLAGISQAKSGKQVLLVDCDIEAPGLADFFSNDYPEILTVRGLVDYITDCSSLEQTRNLNIDIDDYYFVINDSRLVGTNGGELIIVTAGNQSEEENTYISKLSKINAVFGSNSTKYIDQLLQSLVEKFNCDSILIDTRTGLNDWGGLLLTRYADFGFLFFYGTRQNMFGMETVVPNLLQKENLQIQLVNSPIPKIDELAESQKSYYLDKSYSIYSKIVYDDDYSPFINDKTAPHYPIEVYYDDLAISLDDRDKMKELLLGSSDANPYNKIAEIISTYENKNIQPISDESDEKKTFLTVLSSVVPDLAAGEYEFGSLTNLKKYFYPRRDYRFIFDKNKFLILGEKGAGKTALFAVLDTPEYARKLGEFCEVDSNELSKSHWIKGLDKEGNFPEQSTFTMLKSEEITDYRKFWKLLIIAQLSEQEVDSYYKLVKQLKDESEVLLDERIKQINNQLLESDIIKIITYDYLDVLISDIDGLRGNLIGALLEVWRNIHNRYKNIRTKIFLRKDIFGREVQISDKVKISNHSAEISWGYDQLLNIVWKRIWHRLEEKDISNFFSTWFESIDHQYLNDILGVLPKADEEENRKILDLLLGPYMGGNNKAFPYNWILYHISDTQRNIHPRSLLNLFKVSADLQIEKEDYAIEHVIRPRYMEYASKAVSETRVTDIKEEYPSLSPVFDKLHEYIERMPVQESELYDKLEDLIRKEDMNISSHDLVKKLEDIGVLYEYKFRRKGTGRKYHIPDLYLLGMMLKRVGPGAHKALFGKK